MLNGSMDDLAPPLFSPGTSDAAEHPPPFSSLAGLRKAASANSTLWIADRNRSMVTTGLADASDFCDRFNGFPESRLDRMAGSANPRNKARLHTVGISPRASIPRQHNACHTSGT